VTTTERATWLRIATDFATRDLEAREQLADHLDSIDVDGYMAGLADHLRVGTHQRDARDARKAAPCLAN
jgi:hypothetical protein